MPNSGHKFYGFCKTVDHRLARAMRAAAPDFHTVTAAREPPRSPYGGLLRRRGLFNGNSFYVGLFALLIGLVQEPIDDVSMLLFLDPSFLCFRLFGEELVVYFPTHRIRMTE